MTQIAPLTSMLSIWTEPHPMLERISPMGHLYNRLDGMYPNRWRANFTGKDAIKAWTAAWAEAFEDDGLTFADIRTGIKNCRRMFDWPPSITEFMRACRPGLDPETAFYEAVRGLAARRQGERGIWTHPAIYHAAVNAGQHDVLNCAYSLIKTRWGKCLSDELDKGQWEDIPYAAVALPEPKKTEMTNAEAAKAMRRLGAGDVMNKSGRDHKAWAAKIIASPQGRSPAVMDMARRMVEGARA